jgi:hypothetical protein
LIESARKAGKYVHVGRVNTRRRLRYFQLAGAHSVDGNALKFFDDNYPIIHQTLEQPSVFEVLFEKGCVKDYVKSFPIQILHEFGANLQTQEMSLNSTENTVSLFCRLET